MKLIIIEDGLKSNDGHYLNNCLAIKQWASKCRIETQFLINKNSEKSVIEALAAIPCISFTQFDRVSDDPLSGNLESHLIQSSRIASNLLAFFNEHLVHDDIVYYPTASFNQLAALAILIEKLPKLKSVKYIFNFVIQDFYVKGRVEFNQNSSFYRMAANRIKRNLSCAQTLMTANGKEMASAVSFMLNMKVYQYPMPKNYPEILFSKSVDENKNNRPLIGVFGSMYGSQKGLHLLPKLVGLIHGVDWLIQEPSSQKKSLWGGAEEIIRSFGNVQYIAHGLEVDDYYNNFKSVDIVLTPYMIRKDKIQSSGIVSEAAASGKVIVSPANAWVNEHIQTGSIIGCVYFDWTVESIRESVQVAVDNLNSLKQKASLVASDWRYKQSADAYLSKAFEFFAQQTK